MRPTAFSEKQGFSPQAGSEKCWTVPGAAWGTPSLSHGPWSPMPAPSLPGARESPHLCPPTPASAFLSNHSQGPRQGPDLDRKPPGPRLWLSRSHRSRKAVPRLVRAQAWGPLVLWSLCPASRESLARVGFLEARWTAATQTAVLLDTVQPAATDSSGRGHVGSGPRTHHTQRPGYRAHTSKWASRQLVPRRNRNPAPHP